MKRIIVFALIGCLLGCDGQRTKTKEEKAADAEMQQVLEGNPGLKKECLEKERSGKLRFMGWADNPDCYDMLAPQRWSGLWNSGWEWTNFCPDPAKDCPNESDHDDVWLDFAEGAYRGTELADGVYRIDFIGRRTKVPGYFGHLGQYDHLMVVDRVISIKRIPGEKYAKR